jgi:hypothetical protein
MQGSRGQSCPDLAKSGVKQAREVCSYLGIFYKITGLLPAVRRRKQILPTFTEESSL